tara:strand:- start:489 stop:701 length:213 start_codon:yes stop_codon:yes gene_type:complete
MTVVATILAMIDNIEKVIDSQELILLNLVQFKENGNISIIDHLIDSLKEYLESTEEDMAEIYKIKMELEE